MNQRFWLTSFFSLTIVAALSSDVTAATRHRQSHHAKKTHEAGKHSAAVKKHRHATHAAAKRHKADRAAEIPSRKVEAPPLSGDLAAVKQAFDLARKAKTGEATNIERTIGDPAGRKLVEWFILRHPDADANFSRYAVFIADNPNWPSIGLMRRRAEARLWQERSDGATVHGFTQDEPAGGKGRFKRARGPL